MGIQILKSSVSIASNIAEGSSRDSQKDYLRFIGIAVGSTFELETQLLIAKANKSGNLELLDKILKDVTEEEKMLSGFQSTIKESLRSKKTVH